MTKPAPKLTEEPESVTQTALKAEYSAALRAGDHVAVDRIQRQIFAKPVRAPEAANDNIELPAEPSDGLPAHLCYPPGAVGDFARFIVSASRFPSPPLALCASLALTAVLAGRRYKGPTGLRTNVYLVGLAESGMGKDITLRAPRIIAGAGSDGAGIANKFLDADPASPEGLAMRLREDPSVLAAIDEFGKWLSERTSRTAAAHKAGIVSAMMRLTGAASGAWGGAEKAAGKQATIHAPCFSIHGVTTPSTFWAALGAGNISEGLLGRLIVIDAGTRLPTKVRRPADTEDVPVALTAHVKALAGKEGGRSFCAAYSTGENPPSMVAAVPYGDDAEDEFEGFDDRIRAEAPSTDPAFRPVLMRVAENAGRLALIVAVGCNPGEPVITVEIQRWANDVAEASYRTMVRGAADNIADNDRQASYLRVRSMIARRRREGLAQGKLVSNLRGSIDSRMLDDILGQLFESGDCIYGEARAGSGQATRRWWATEHRPEGFIQTLRPRPGDPQMRR
ncbi:DUF3987 domain-containing protein [Bosea sp. 2RAB26]|uniref:DUF3987 domain-containing protein n=1 Tax=Bosea sp. 2RAB26 TaxID=3237476 RepID=UPI003F92465F